MGMTANRSGMLSAVIAASLMVSGCQDVSGGADAACNPTYGALIGGALGAVVSDKTDQTKGALIGAGVGTLACLVINSYSKQTKTAQQAEDEYRKQHNETLPPAEPVLQAYDVNVANNGRIHAGEKIQIVSNMTVVQGSAQPINEVKEVLTLSGPNGTKKAEKKANERSGSGGYQNTFNLSFPADVAAGNYPIATQLFVNGKLVGERQQQLQIVAIEGGFHFALMQTTPNSL